MLKGIKRVLSDFYSVTLPSSLTHSLSPKGRIVFVIHNSMFVFWWGFARCDYKLSYVSILIIVVLWIKDDDDKILSCTMKSLKEGHVIAVPTDTIYGLACLAQNSEAIRKIYDIKGRNQQKPLAICVGQIQDIYKWVFA